MVLVPILLICAGLAIVILSADEAIKRLFNLAKYLRLSEFVVSFVIAGIVTVLPELSIGVLAAVEGTSSLGFGVILGSNIADLTLVIGIALLFSGEMQLDKKTIKNIRLSFLAVILPVILLIDGEISRIDGGILVIAFMLYLFVILRSKREQKLFWGKKPKLRLLFEVLILGASFLILFIGGTLVTDNSQSLSSSLGLPLFVVGAIVALGTCMPELVFSIRCCKKDHTELGLGNILGNVLADSMLTIGVIALIQPIKPQFPVPPFLTSIFMVACTAVVYILSTDGRLDKRDGVLLVAIYAVFIVMQGIIGLFI
jgi:cation:H+ antiporter